MFYHNIFDEFVHLIRESLHSTLGFKSRTLRQVKGAQKNFNLCCLFINDFFL